MAKAPANKSLRTGAAAQYLTERGVQSSRSLLEKLRARGSQDPRGRGPDFWRDERGVCWYDILSLDRYIQARLSARRFRTTAPVPANFAGQ